jgi:hypothetical protein
VSKKEEMATKNAKDAEGNARKVEIPSGEKKVS